MDLHCCVERNGPGWAQESPEALDSFDADCKEWERQLRDMQRNIEELYNEVKARREGTETGLEQKSDPILLNGGLHSTGSTFNRHGNGFNVYQHNHGNRDTLLHCSSGTCHPPNLLNNGSRDKPVGYTNGVLFSAHSNGWDNHDDCSDYGFGSSEICNSNGCSFPTKHNGDDGQERAMRELEEMLSYCLGQASEHPAQYPSIPSNKLQSIQAGCKYENEKNTALDEIARVNEQAHSYQNEIRNISKDTSLNRETSSKMGKVGSEEENNRRNKMSLPGGQWCDMSSFPEKMETTHPCANFWYPDSSETQRPAPECDPDRKCAGPSSFLGQKCISPTVLRKFGEMLKENEGKTLLDSGHITTARSAGATDRACCSPGKLQMSVQKSSPDTGFQKGSNVISSKCPKGQSQLIGHKGDQMNPKGPTIARPCTEIQSPQRKRTVVGKKAEFIGSSVKSPMFEGGCLEWQGPSHTQRMTEEALDSWGSSSGSGQPGDRGPYRNGSSVLPVDQIDDIFKLVDILELHNQSSSCKNAWSTKLAKVTMKETTMSSSTPISRPFSRPARPPNRRPPSRWAGRAPATGAWHSRPPAEKQTPCSFSRQTETVIM